MEVAQSAESGCDALQEPAPVATAWTSRITSRASDPHRVSKFQELKPPPQPKPAPAARGGSSRKPHLTEAAPEKKAARPRQATERDERRLSPRGPRCLSAQRRE